MKTRIREGYPSVLLQDSLAEAGLIDLLPCFLIEPERAEVIEMSARAEEGIEALAA